MVMGKYDALFTRTYMGKLGIKNRFVMAPMGIGANATSGVFDEQGIAYYAERAKGGAGMLNIGFQIVTNKTDPFTSSRYGVGTPMMEMGWANLVDRVHGYGTAVCLQLSCGLGRNAPVLPGKQNVSSSENTCFWDPAQKTRALSIDEIHDIVRSFGVAAKMAKNSGADCIEIHGHAGYLLDQFMTPLWNHRDDEYGAQTFENKVRLATEIYHACRDAVGPDMPILFRLAIGHKIPGGRTKEESAEIIRYLDKLGIDAFDVDMGCYESYDWIFPTCYMPDGCMMDTSGEFARSITEKPILTTGSYTADTALEAVQEGKTDFVVVGRGMLSDPEFVNKVHEQRLEDIRPCIKCNRFCIGAGGMRDTTCSVNPQVLKETVYKLEKTDSPKKVVIVGGGVGGMEAAMVAAEKGHNVILYEKSDQLGGQLISASVPSFKGRLRDLNHYYEAQLKKLSVKVVKNKEITENSPELDDADKIILAAGATGFIPPIKGAESSNVLEVIDAHTGDQSRIGQKVIVAGGGPSGCDCAIELAMEGKDVTLVEMLPELYPTATPDNKTSVMRRIDEEDIHVLTSTKVKAFTPDGAIVETADGVKDLTADTVIVAMGTKPNAKIAKAISDSYTNAQMIGDCKQIGQVGEAVREGFMAAWTID